MDELHLLIYAGPTETLLKVSNACLLDGEVGESFVSFLRCLWAHWGPEHQKIGIRPLLTCSYRTGVDPYTQSVEREVS